MGFPATDDERMVMGSSSNPYHPSKDVTPDVYKDKVLNDAITDIVLSAKNDSVKDVYINSVPNDI